MLPAMLLACTASGRRRWRWATGWRSVRRGASRSPPTGSSTPCGRTAFVTGDVLYLPTDHTVADDVIRAVDLAMVYGGQDVVDKYARNPRVLMNGPGRTKILITAECDWRDYLDVIVDSIANLGGMACVNATAVLYEGDAAPLAHAIARAAVDDRAAAEHRRTGHSANDFHRGGAGSRRSPRGQGRRDGRGSGRRPGGRRPRRRVRRPAPGRAPAGHTRPGQAQRRTALPLCVGLAVVAWRTVSRRCETRWCST